MFTHRPGLQAGILKHGKVAMTIFYYDKKPLGAN